MEYTYNILDKVYSWMLSKQKNVEVRILKEKSEKIQIGDIITFNNQENEGKYIKAKVINKKSELEIESIDCEKIINPKNRFFSKTDSIRYSYCVKNKTKIC